MLEEFVSIALEAFANANGEVDKFELHLRRKLMSFNIVTPQVVNTLWFHQTLIMYWILLMQVTQFSMNWKI